LSFKIELLNNNVFKTAFESITQIVDEVVLHLDQEGFKVNAIDRSHICFVSLELDYTFFDEYQVEVPEKICIDTQELMTILKRMKKNDVLCLSVEENNFVIQLKGDVDREFKLRIIDSDYEVPPLPSIPLPTKIAIPSMILTEAIKDMELFSENLTFKVTDDYLYIFTDGEFGDSEVKYLHGENISDTVQASFSIDKLKDMLKSSKFSDDVKLSIDNNKPLRLDFELLTDDGKLSFLLAPRLEVDED